MPTCMHAQAHIARAALHSGPGHHHRHLPRAADLWAAQHASVACTRARTSMSGHAWLELTSAPLALRPPAGAIAAPATPPRVVVLGGGFGGLYAAVRLDQLLWPKGTKPEVRVRLSGTTQQAADYLVPT